MNYPIELPLIAAGIIIVLLIEHWPHISERFNTWRHRNRPQAERRPLLYIYRPHRQTNRDRL